MPKPPPTAAKIESSLPKEGSFAYKQMLKMGWKPGSGLGQNGDGQGVIEVVKRAEGVGIGAGIDRGTEGWKSNDGLGENRNFLYATMPALLTPSQKNSTR